MLYLVDVLTIVFMQNGVCRQTLMKVASVSHAFRKLVNNLYESTSKLRANEPSMFPWSLTCPRTGRIIFGLTRKPFIDHLKRLVGMGRQKQRDSRHEAKTLFPAICGGCQRRFEASKGFNNHKKAKTANVTCKNFVVHAVNTHKEYKCKLCDVEPPAGMDGHRKSAFMFQHNAATHEPWWECPFCGLSFPVMGNFEAHLKAKTCAHAKKTRKRKREE